MLDLIIKNGQCHIDGRLKNIDIAIKGGKIVKIGETLEEAKNVYDAKENMAQNAVRLQNNYLYLRALFQ